MEGRRTLVCPVLVGRDDLLELADRRIEEVAAGAGHVLLLAGEAGLGKTRLSEAIRRRASAAGFQVHVGGAYPSDLQVAAAVLLDLARAMRRDPRSRGLAEQLETRLSEGAAGAGDAHRRRRLLVLDVAELLADAAVDGPILVVLEDLHWSDDLTLEILESTARLAHDVPLLLLGTYRSDELYPRVPMRQWRARLLSQRLAEEIRLRRLTPDDVATMTTLLAGDGLPASRGIADAVHRRSDGIPLHVEELLASLPSDLADPRLVESVTVPDTLEAAIAARMDRRSPRAVAVSEAGAVIGRSFDLDLLAAVLDEPLETLDGPLGELADHFLLLPAPQPGRYAFRHALIGEAIYERIPEPRRRVLHARTAAAAMLRPDVGTNAFLALHHDRAGRRAEAFEASSAGAEAAAAMSSHGEAMDLFAIALRTAPADLDPVARGRLLEAYAHHAAATDANQVAADAYESARAAYLEGGDALAAAAVVAPLVGVRHLLGDGLAGRAERLQEAVAEVAAVAPPDGGSRDPAADEVRARLLAELAAAYMLDRRLDEAMTVAREARRFAALVDAEGIDRHAATTLGVCEVFAGRMDDGWARLEDGLARSLAEQLEAEAARGYRMLGTAASVLVEYDRAERWLREGIDYAERVELWNHRHYMAAHLAHVRWATGHWVDADSIARHALADGRGGVTTRITALHVLGYIALGRGDPIAATATLGEARALGERMGELQRLSPALWGLAEQAVLAGDASAAVGLCEAGYDASAAVDDAAYLYPFAVTGTRAYLAAEDPTGARDWVDRVTAALDARAIPGTLAGTVHARGLLALADGRTAIARTALREAIEVWGARGRVWEGAWAMADLARALGRANLPGQAREARMAVRAIAERLGSAVLLAAASTSHGGDDAADADPWAPLTAREYEVARRIAEGRTNAGIADDLGISPKTVSAHVEHILGRLDVGRRTEIAAWVAQRSAEERVLHSRPHGDDREE